MCGYDPFALYDWLMDREAEAYQAGYDSYEDYYVAMKEDKENEDFDRYHELFERYHEENC